MQRMIRQQIDRAMTQVRQAFRGVISRASSAQGIQYVSLNGLDSEQLRDNEQFQEYGLTSNPPAGTMAVVIPVNGKTSHGIIIATEHATYRLVGLKPGEVALYTDEGAKIVLKRGRIIEVDCDVYRVNCLEYEVNAVSKADFNTPTLTASEEAVVNGKVTGKGGLALSGGAGGGPAAVIEGSVEASGDGVFNGVSSTEHRHVETGGTTDAPIPG